MTSDDSGEVRENRRATADFEAFWKAEYDDASVLHEEAPPTPPRLFDLEERTAPFGEAVIAFAKRLPFSPVNNRLIDQTVGANYCEADDAVSKREFIVNINRCRKESHETKFFLRMIASAEPSLKADARVLWREATELNRIFSTIVRKARAALNDEARMANAKPASNQTAPPNHQPTPQHISKP